MASQIAQEQTQTIEKLRAIPELVVWYETPKEKKVIDALEKIWNYAPQKTETQSREKAVRRLVDYWFALKLYELYPILPPDIYTLKRKVTVDLAKQKVSRHGDKTTLKKAVEVELPLFCHAEIEEASWAHSFESSLNGNSYEVTLESPAPYIPPKAKKEAALAKSYCYELYAQALKKSPLSGILTAEKDIFPQPAEATLGLIWYARPSDLGVTVKKVRLDPAIVLTWNKTGPYLVYHWTEKNSSPIEDLVLNAMRP